jgi:VanZ family protein
MNVKALTTFYFTTMCFTCYAIQVSLKGQLRKPSIYVGHVTHKLLKLVHIFVGLFKGNLLFMTSYTWMNQTKIQLKSLLLICRFIAQMSLG